MAKRREVTKESYPRAINKHNRSLRRDQIIARWERRKGNRDFAALMERTGGHSLAVIEGVLYYQKTIPADDLLEYVDPAILKATLIKALRIIELKEMPYSEYLETPEWKARAAHAKKQFLNRCALDNEHPADDAHHRTYERRGHEHPTDLVPLCRDCHSKFHGHR